MSGGNLDFDCSHLGIRQIVVFVSSLTSQVAGGLKYCIRCDCNCRTIPRCVSILVWQLYELKLLLLCSSIPCLTTNIPSISSTGAVHRMLIDGAMVWNIMSGFSAEWLGSVPNLGRTHRQGETAGVLPADLVNVHLLVYRRRTVVAALDGHLEHRSSWQRFALPHSHGSGLVWLSQSHLGGCS